MSYVPGDPGKGYCLIYNNKEGKEIHNTMKGCRSQAEGGEGSNGFR